MSRVSVVFSLKRILATRSSIARIFRQRFLPGDFSKLFSSCLFSPEASSLYACSLRAMLAARFVEKNSRKKPRKTLILP